MKKGAPNCVFYGKNTYYILALFFFWLKIISGMKEKLTKQLHLLGKTAIFCQVHKAKQIAFPNLGVPLKIDCHIGECQLILSCYTFSSHAGLFSQCIWSLSQLWDPPLNHCCNKIKTQSSDTVVLWFTYPMYFIKTSFNATLLKHFRGLK